MTTYTLFKIKNGKRQKWLDWCHELEQRHEEVIVTLKEENLLRERCLLFGEGYNSYLLYMHTPANEDGKQPANLDKEINVKHFQIYDECLEKIPFSEVGYDISVAEIYARINRRTENKTHD